jgi:hypothetical protein
MGIIPTTGLADIDNIVGDSHCAWWLALRLGRQDNAWKHNGAKTTE